MPSLRQDKQTRRACACFCVQPSMFVQGEREGGSVFECRWSRAPLSVRRRECSHTSAEEEPRARSLRASPVRVRCARWQVTLACSAGHVCPPLQGFLPSGTLSWWGRRGLHKPVPSCLALCWPFNTLVSRWAQLLLKVTIKWQQLWHLLTSRSAQLKGLVASQRGGPECPPVC